MQVNDFTPTIQIHRKKNPGVPSLVISSERQTEQGLGDKLVSIDDAGLHVRHNELNVVLMTPGNAISQEMLLNGFQTHMFTLNAAWDNESTETEIEIFSATSSAEYRHIQNLEVALDDLSQPSTVSSTNARIYIKRWGVYRNTHLRVWLVLGVDLGGENEVASGRFIRVSFNNKLIL